MSVTFVLTPPEEAPAVAVRLTGRVLVLGRGPKAQLSLPDPSVSERHACLKKRGAHYLLSDEGSTNGTAVWSEDAQVPVYLAQGSPRVLISGDRLVLGHVQLHVYFEPPPFELELVEDPVELPGVLVVRALRARGLHVTTEDLTRALRELESAPDENLHHQPTPEPPQLPTMPEEIRENSFTADLILAGFILLVLVVGLYALLGLL